MNFINPLIIIKSKNKFLLNVMCYFSKFVIIFATKDANLESVIMCLKLFFLIYRTSFAFYCDKGQHFDNTELRDFLKIKKIAINYSPSESSKSIEMTEVFNKILKDVLRKDNSSRVWDERLSAAAKSLNTRIIPLSGDSDGASSGSGYPTVLYLSFTLSLACRRRE